MSNEEQQYTLAAARRIVKMDSVTLAGDLYLLDNPMHRLHQWQHAPGDVRRNYILSACAEQRKQQALLDAAQAEADEKARRQAKLSAIDAYRASIAGTIPAHRLDTRVNGFMDGWDAAMRALRGEDTK